MVYLLPHSFELHSFVLVFGPTLNDLRFFLLSPTLVINLPRLPELELLSVSTACVPASFRQPSVVPGHNELCTSQASMTTCRVGASYLKIA